MRGLLLLSALLGRGAPKPFVSEEGSFAVSFPRAPIYATLTVPRMVQTVPGAGSIYSLIVLGDHGSYYSLTAAPRSEAAASKAQAFLDSFKVRPSTGKAWCHAK